MTSPADPPEDESGEVDAEEEPAGAESAAAEPAGAEPAGAEPAAAEPAAAEPSGATPRVRSRSRRAPRTTRGLFVLFALVGGLGAAMAAGTVVAVQWTETADFCGRCHTMGPELQAYATSPHREVACVECHTEPGIQGWIKSKVNGVRQLVEVLTGTFPKPIPAPDHALLPSTKVTCQKCHDVAPLVAQGGPIKLVLENRYRLDATNTRDAIALVVRPYGFGGTAGTRGLHWHITSDVEYVTSDPRAQTIDYVAITEPNGEKEQFIAAGAVGISTDVQPDVDRLLAAGTTRQMDCIDCHNRVGHAIPDLNQAIDDQIDAGTVDSSLPFIKREASDRLSIQYASLGDADNAIDGLRDFYAQRYPLVAASQSSAIDSAIASLKTIYRLVATPEMRVTAATYPNNIGHQTSPGCFRCHDGAHYRIVDGAITSETIPSQCATCHTYPQIGSTESGVLIGQRPDTHNDRLWVFDHKSSVTSADPSGASCGACHTKTYCENCHKTAAVNVTHEDMVFNHAAVTRQVGAAACAYCHQPAYCAQCHSDRVLPQGPSDNGSPGGSLDGSAGEAAPP
jgi:nitrate/TMAO reductase-like tetraheme cytochrome c subunit